METMPAPEYLITRKDAAARLKVSIPTIARWMSEGRFTIYKLKVGNAVRLDVREVDSMFQLRTCATNRG